jgi:hypothetical protein
MGSRCRLPETSNRLSGTHGERPFRRTRWSSLLVVTLAALFGIQLASSSTEASAATVQPLYTTKSIYVGSDSTLGASEAGCAQANEDILFFDLPSGVVLDFGGQLANRTGTKDIEDTMQFTNAEIESVSEAYATGYVECVGEFPEATLDLVIGTDSDFDAVSAPGGKTWAGLVATVASKVLETPLEAALVSISGGDDMEPTYSTPSAAKAWAKGYSETTESPEVDYGSADGCPEHTHIHKKADEKCTPKEVQGEWTQKDEYQLSWEIRGDNPLPEIYYNPEGTPVNAEQWAEIDLWGASRMHFLGDVSQNGYRESDSSSESWYQLKEVLEKDGLNHELHYSTEI